MTRSLSLPLKYVLGLILVLSLVDTASAVKCGDRITSNTVLSGDLSCDCSKFNFKAALTVVGPATLDLNGHTVSCSKTSIPFTYCIAIRGNGVTIQNGAVTACFFGVGGPGEVGRAVIRNIVATAQSTGFLLNGNRNRLTRVTAKNHVNAGVSIGGNNNRLVYVTTKDNNDDGVAVTGENNTVLHVTATGNAGYGISTYGRFNQVKDSYAGGQPNAEGINIAGDNGSAISNVVEDSLGSNCMRGTSAFGRSGGTLFENNTVRRCGGYGLSVNVGQTTIANNKFFSTSNTSIFVSAGDFIITGNQITGSRVDGIQLTSGQGTVVFGNSIVNSTRNGILLSSSSLRSTIGNNNIRQCGNTGLLIQGSDFNEITENKVAFCKTGIKADAGSQSNSLTNNRVSKSASVGLYDNSTNCGSNVWQGNTGRGNIPCTKK
jgi:hypothetical protein